MKMKYIEYKTEMKGVQILIFGMDTSHDFVGSSLESYEILSAGFIDIDVTREPYGESTSMKKKANPFKVMKYLKNVEAVVRGRG